jgi:hypothetical protein
MNGARINTAYGTLDQYSVILSSLREVADIPIIIDIKGPEIRLKTKGRRIVNKGDVLKVGKDEKISFNNNIYDDMDVGDTVLIDNGKLRTQVIEKQKDLLKLRAATNGEIDDGKGVNIPNKKKEVVFRVNAIGSADVYATVKGHKDGKYFWWESSWTSMHVSDEKAYLESLLVLSNPYTTIGKTLSAEATVKGLRKSSGLRLEFWVETPSGKNEQQAKIDIKELSVGEEARYTAEFTPKETGRYSVYAYLYDEWRRIDHKMNYIYAQKQ